ncbi:MAG: tRNA (cytidine(34)-2'-O)-methyltransferase [Holosporales bacterium]|jgi:tRNA (cytidine/uridine-2'-O-)-methyltransferase|nr:tRNA (cytidine(34)-2'-O)-methyltransferase [Holosporales bacterium]
MEICLFEPEIAQNAGTIARLCVCFGIDMSIIEPSSFILTDKNFKRAGMDYLQKTNIKLHSSFAEFKKQYQGRIILFDTKATKNYYDFQFQNTDCLIFGKESIGIPREIFKQCDEALVIPMIKDARSLNLAITVAIGLSEAIRQIHKHLS